MTTVSLAWMVFVISFFLPATNVLQMSGTPPGTPLTGWQALTTAIEAGAMNPWVFLFEPRVVLVLVYPVANCLMLFAPVFIFLLRERSAGLALLLVPATIPIWCLPNTLRGDLYVGSYCWQASFVLMAIGCVLVSLAVGVGRAESGPAIRSLRFPER